jgi:hypothetical protein
MRKDGRYDFTGLEGTMKQIVILFALTLAGLTGKLTTKEATMIAQGTFEVKVTPQQAQDGEPFGRLLLDKQFHGDLDATSKGQMLAAETAVKDSGGYVAFELVRGVLNGKRGSFILQHKGTMARGVYSIEVTVVPDSGTDELSGITGTMFIIIEGNKHSYKFEYSFE